jgi:hypothetical protein
VYDDCHRKVLGSMELRISSMHRKFADEAKSTIPFPANTQQTVDSRQQTAESRQETADRKKQKAHIHKIDKRQQTAGSRQETRDSRQQTSLIQQTAGSRQWSHLSSMDTVTLPTDGTHTTPVYMCMCVYIYVCVCVCVCVTFLGQQALLIYALKG